MSTLNYLKILYFKKILMFSLCWDLPWQQQAAPPPIGHVLSSCSPTPRNSWIIHSFTFPGWLSWTVSPVLVFLMTAPCFTHSAVYLSSSLVQLLGFLWPSSLAHVPALWVWSDLGPSSSHSDLKPVRQPDIKNQNPGGYSFSVLMFTFNIATYGSSHRPSKYCQNPRSFF